jgi:hypothetical protein
MIAGKFSAEHLFGVHDSLIQPKDLPISYSIGRKTA